MSRAGYYRQLGPKPSARDDADLRDLIQRIALRQPSLRLSAHRAQGSATRGPGRQRQAGAAADARGQSARACAGGRSFRARRSAAMASPIAPNLRAGSNRPASTRSGSPTSLMSGSPRPSSIWRSSSTPSRAKWWAGRSTTIWRRAWPCEALDKALAARNPAPEPHPPLRSRRAIRFGRLCRAAGAGARSPSA